MEEEDKKIQTALATANVTEQILAGLKADYMPLVVTDKASLKAVKAARTKCRELRGLAVDIATGGREKAILVQRAWIAKEKEIVDVIKGVELHLKTQEERWEAEQSRLALIEENKTKLPYRLEKLKSIEEEIPEDRLLNMTDGDFAISFNNLQTQYLGKQRAAQEEKDKAAKLEKERVFGARVKSLYDLGLKFDGRNYSFDDIVVAENALQEFSEADWLEVVMSLPERIATKKDEIKAAEAAQKEKERLQALEDDKARREKEDAAEKEKDRLKQIEDEKAAALLPDKVKLKSYLGALLDIPTPELTTGELSAKLEAVRKGIAQAANSL